MKDASSNWTARWLIPVVLLGGGAMAIFVFFYVVDHYLTPPLNPGDPSDDGAVNRYLSFVPDKITDAVSALAAMVAAVLGIVITVVSIIVQLSADRYTGVARMFLADRTNRLVMSFYVVTCASAVWLSMSLQSDWAPRTLLVVIMAATTIGLVLMLPYFTYVFWFLEPTNIVDRIRHQAVLTVKRVAQARAKDVAAIQVRALAAMEELTDITSNSISGKDKIIASRAVDALKDYCEDYLSVKETICEHNDQWFKLSGDIKSNPDFVAMDGESLDDLEERGTWFEWKILRQYLGIYNEALLSMRDICYLVAIDTRYIGQAATRIRGKQEARPDATGPARPDKGDRELIKLVFYYMNSYLRTTLNAGDVRTAYNVLNQYRKLVEFMLRNGHGEDALEGVKHMNYYGRVSYDMKLTFVTETVAYDVSAICQVAHAEKSAHEEQMLAQFLELDQPLQVQSQEKGLLGVRKAQVKLAAYYLSKGEEHKARRIADDMKDEPHRRLVVIRDQLRRVVSKDFWEIIDRGRNFEYMPDNEREQMDVFFRWLGLDTDLEGVRPVTSPLTA